MLMITETQALLLKQRRARMQRFADAAIRSTPPAAPPRPVLTATDAALVQAWFQQAWQLLDPLFTASQQAQRIRYLVAKHYRVDEAELIGTRRTPNVVLPRQIAMYLAKTLTHRSLPEIGRCFGGRDHTTVMHAVRKITALRAADAEIAADIEAIEREVKR